MNLNKLIFKDLEFSDEELKEFFKLKSGSVKSNNGVLKPLNSRNEYPNYFTYEYITSKPENQGKTGTCVTHTATTVGEMLIWKITGTYKEFTNDEIYNLYLDQVNSRSTKEVRQIKWIEYTEGYDNFTEAYHRKILRGNDSNKYWDSIRNSLRDGGELIYLRFGGLLCGDGVEFPLKENSIWNCIYNFNDPEIRKNHYPDIFSENCFILHNYIYNNMYRYFSDKSSPQYYDTVPPLRIKQITSSSSNPYALHIPGHGVASYGYDSNSIYMNSSWNDKQVYIIEQPYNLTEPYYDKNSKYNGKEDSRFKSINGIDFYDRKLEDSTLFRIKMKPSTNGKIIGIASQDKFKENDIVQLSAQADNNYYFTGWSDGDKTNPRQITITKDLEIGANFSTVKPSDTKFKVDIVGNHCKITGVSDIYYPIGTELNISVQCDDDFEFVEWSDGVATSSRKIIVENYIFLTPLVRYKGNLENCTIRAYDFHLSVPNDNPLSTFVNYTYADCSYKYFFKGDDVNVYLDDKDRITQSNLTQSIIVYDQKNDYYPVIGCDCDISSNYILGKDLYEGFKVAVIGKNPCHGTLSSTLIQQGVLKKLYLVIVMVSIDKTVMIPFDSILSISVGRNLTNAGKIRKNITYDISNNNSWEDLRRGYLYSDIDLNYYWLYNPPGTTNSNINISFIDNDFKLSSVYKVRSTQADKGNWNDENRKLSITDNSVVLGGDMPTISDYFAQSIYVVIDITPQNESGQTKKQNFINGATKLVVKGSSTVSTPSEDHIKSIKDEMLKVQELRK